ncbi:DUF454 domain-containing protein [Pikeienuella piscinae]|uniref:DUF454 domain-containing protein n=1 Tax=Pikeienuella piscinae TaxID=2748098 RepID=A0A7M3T6K3_9RHOB|nr:YbaN family protein [Pikeienuella piscinae]QIE57634.1 DUF454 domain-containing protein [Pikeienuella piscinae]
MRGFWLILGCFAVALGVIGAVLPIVPTVPFLLLAAFCFARSSERFYNWLLSHRIFGPPIADWRAHGAIGRRAKWLSTASIAAALIPPFVIGLPWWMIALEGAILTAVLIFIWTRPDGARG